MTNNTTHIVLFIGSLKAGGAERQITLLAKNLVEKGYKVSLVTIYPGGFYDRFLIGDMFFNRIILHERRKCSTILRIIQLIIVPYMLRRYLFQINFECIYSMLDFSNLFALFATIGKLRQKLVWGHRASDVPSGWKMRIADSLCILFSKSVPLMICNSKVGLRLAKRRGYRPQQMSVVPNGIDTEFFRYDGRAAAYFREDIGVARNQPLVGLVGRIAPMKDHSNFIKSASIVRQSVKDVKFIIVGEGLTGYCTKLKNFTYSLGFDNAFLWIGNRTDMPAVYSALDVLISSSSSGEGFSNVIGEAMACETPCVVTDVGDSSWIVGYTGMVVPPRNTEALAEGIVSVFGFGRCPECRDRIEENFSVDMMVENTLSCLRNIGINTEMTR